MGHIHQRVRLAAEKTATVSMLVDTGATFSVIPEALHQRMFEGSCGLIGAPAPSGGEGYWKRPRREARS